VSAARRQLRPLKELGLLHVEVDRTGHAAKLALTEAGRRLACDIDALVMAGYNDAVMRMHPHPAEGAGRSALGASRRNAGHGEQRYAHEMNAASATSGTC
jgi:hypothetical protein